MMVNLLFLFAASAHAAVLSESGAQRLYRRQELSSQIAKITEAAKYMTPAVPAKILQIKPKSTLPGAKRVQIYYGPVRLLGAKDPKPPNPLSMDPNSNVWGNIPQGFPTDITILDTNATFQYADGSLATVTKGVYNHHLAFFSTKKFALPLLQCPGQKTTDATPSTFLGSSEEKGTNRFTSADYKFDSGYYLSKDDVIIMTAEVINYEDKPQDIFVVGEFEYVPGKRKYDTVTEVVTVNQCEGNDLSLRPPPGKKQFSVSSQNMTALRDGYILARRGHLHDGGDSIEFYVNGKLICDSKTLYGGPLGTWKAPDGKIWESVSGSIECNEPIPVKKGDAVSLIAKYDMEKHPARQHAGGAGDSHGAKGGMGSGGMAGSSMGAEEMAIMSFTFAYAA